MDFEEDFVVVYIAGASRSGSTVIEDYLAGHSGGFACGELYRISQFARGNARVVQESGAKDTCSCGARVSDCTFWRAVCEEAGLDLAKTRFRSVLGPWPRAIFRLFVRLVGSPGTKWIAKLVPAIKREIDVGENCFRLYHAISRITGVDVIFDSSKQAHQYYLLKAVAPERIRLISLVRDARAVVASMQKGARGENIARKIKSRTGRRPSPEDVTNQALRAWAQPTLNGLLAFFFTSRKRRTFLHYEAFCNNPVQQSEFIGRRFSITVQAHAHESHAIGGSPSRHTTGFAVISGNTSLERETPIPYEKPLVGFWRLLNRFCGYR